MEDGLKLVTCGGKFDCAEGEYLDNIIVYASAPTSSRALRPTLRRGFSIRGLRLPKSGCAGRDHGFMSVDTNPPAAGTRLPWHEVHPAARAAVEELLGGPVAEAVTQPGGFSPRAAVRLRAADGRRLFVKAVGPEPNPDSAGIYRAEAEDRRRASRLRPGSPPDHHLRGRRLGGARFEDIEGRHPGDAVASRRARPGLGAPSRGCPPR